MKQVAVEIATLNILITIRPPLFVNVIKTNEIIVNNGFPHGLIKNSELNGIDLFNE